MDATVTANYDAMLRLVDLCPTCAMVLDGAGRIAFANSAAQLLLRRGPALIERSGVLRARRREETALLADALARVASHPAASLVTFHSREDFPVFALSLRAVPGRDEVLAIASDLRITSSLDAAHLRQIFTFTPAESRIAIGLANGATLIAIADRLGISIATARGHMSALLAKAGVPTQAQLLRALLRAEELLPRWL